MAFAFFFFSAETLQKRFLPKKKLYTKGEVIVPNYKPTLITIFSVYFIIQIGLPLRHWFFKDDVLWTEEGHRLSWRMMLRSKAGSLSVWVKDKDSTERRRYNYNQLLSKKQQRSVKSKPDMLWQLAQRIEETEAKKGRNVEVYMDVQIKVNTGTYHRLIDKNVDLAAEPWHHFKHHDWILSSSEGFARTKK